MINFRLFRTQPPLISPSSDQNEFVNRLNFAFETSGLKPQNLTVRQFQNEVDFILANGYSTQVLLSTEKNPYWQLSTLQKLQKLAKINGKLVKLIDLNAAHPYATLENN